ncbi:hypothetical protein BD410DRAFT_381804 [Rickenella mellea]|uniref:F-box domain-containing protein n=1 Tax=Rickenella mellea TaxID=50990 RepID=A0A4Y7PXJ9_9AGAM|nr:hypothetical protein BD410DRAFT_381804 [Rickenella mellea]
MAHLPMALPLGVFLTVFRNIKVLRLGDNFRLKPATSFRAPTKASLDGLPSLHTIETSKVPFFYHFRKVPFPSLPTLHVRNENFVDWRFVYHLLQFLPTCGGNIKRLTIFGTVVEPYAGNIARALHKFMKLEEIVMDVIDLYRLLPFDPPLHPLVTELTLTNYAPNSFPSANNFHESLIPNLSARFPRWKSCAGWGM